MRILITGAFGNIGKALLHEAQKKNHERQCDGDDKPAQGAKTERNSAATVTPHRGAEVSVPRKPCTAA